MLTLRRLILLCVALPALACSFVFVDGPPPLHEQMPYFECSSSHAAPVLDTIWTCLQSLILLTASVSTDEQWSNSFHGRPPFSGDARVVVYKAAAALGAAGMFYGYSNVSECKQAKNALMLRMAGGPPPGSWPPAPPTQREPPVDTVQPESPSAPPPPAETPDEPARTPIKPRARR